MVLARLLPKNSRLDTPLVTEQERNEGKVAGQKNREAIRKRWARDDVRYKVWREAVSPLTWSRKARERDAKDNGHRVYLSRLRQYGLTFDKYCKMLDNQDGRCAVCKKPFGRSTPRIDHDHTTERVRGMLCNRCNLFVGHIESYLHEKALVYLAQGT